MPRRPDPRSFLPLTPIALQVLLALSGESRHGYGIIGEVDRRTDGLMRLRTGTLYVLLQRLTADGLIEPTSAPASASREKTPGSPRRYYAVTSLGRDVTAAEARRLAAVVNEARRQRVIGREA
jgi:DNA-binding PadR family transcriptional regulator